ncbi:MAG: hypothetical protein PVF96_03340 [Candidatus Bathyarchaeota archaeon]|jgi:hypothetical protein
MSEIEKMVEDFKKGASEKEKKLLVLYLEYSTEKISLQKFSEETSKLEFPAPNFYIACILGALMKSVISFEKKVTGIEKKLEKMWEFSSEKSV